MFFGRKLNYLLDFLIPRSNSQFSSIHGYLTDAEIANLKFSRAVPAGLEIQALLGKLIICADYHDPLIEDLLHRAKFFGETAICESLADLILAKTTLETRPEAIIPIPPDPKRFSQRGYHLPNLICAYLTKKLDLISLEALEKLKTTKSQTELDKENRKKNLADVFALKEEFKTQLSKYTRVWLVDDVTTTQSTLLECAKVLNLECPELEIVAIAVAG